MAKKKYDEHMILADPGVQSESNMLGFGNDGSINFGGIGFGASGLFGENNAVETMDIDKVIPLEDNPMNMDEDENFMALVESMKELGFLKEQPLVGERRSDGTALLISGNRRRLAAKYAGIQQVPIILKTFNSDDERNRFKDVYNTYRHPKLKDIISRYEHNAALYDRGYWDDKPVGKKSKLDCVSIVIGYPKSKLHNILFLSDIRKSHEMILDLIDEDVIVVNDLRKLVSLNKEGKVKNFNEVLDMLCTDVVLTDKDAEKKERKAIAKKIINSAEIKGKRRTIEEKEKKKAYKEIPAFEKRISKAFKDGFIAPATAKQKEDTLSAIDNMLEIIGNYKKEIEELEI